MSVEINRGLRLIFQILVSLITQGVFKQDDRIFFSQPKRAPLGDMVRNGWPMTCANRVMPAS
jgi:hypothetical protein